MAFRPRGEDADAPLLCVERLVSTTNFPILKTWIPARITLLQVHFEVPVSFPPAELNDEGINLDELAEIEEMFEE